MIRYEDKDGNPMRIPMPKTVKDLLRKGKRDEAVNVMEDFVMRCYDDKDDDNLTITKKIVQNTKSDMMNRIKKERIILGKCEDDADKKEAELTLDTFDIILKACRKRLNKINRDLKKKEKNGKE